MSEVDAQRQAIHAIEKVIDSKMSTFNHTRSEIGVVTEDPRGFDAKVKIGKDIVSCTVSEHLHSWIQKDDIVTIQDLYGDGQKRLIVGKMNQIQNSPSLVFYDPETDKNISGRDGIFEGDDKINYGTVEI